MPRKRHPVQLTTESKAVLEGWRKFAKDNNIELAEWNPLHLRAEQLAKNGGKCPCLPDKRPKCPCMECLEEVKKDGVCFCCVFGNLKRYKEVRGLR